MAQTEQDTAPAPVPAEPGGSNGRPRRGPGLRAALARATVENPVLVKEFRTRMRGTRAYWLLLAYTLLLAGVVAMMYFGYEASAIQQAEYTSGGNPQAARELGRAIYYFVFIAQAIMVALITPAITAGTVTIEREQRSYELLVTTPLRPVDVIRGKLAAAVSFVVLLLTASLPLVSLSFLVGGVSPAEIFFSYLLVALSAFVYGAIGIFWSATLQTSAAATVVTYLTVLSLFILTVIPGTIAASSGGPGGTGDPGIPFQSLNPITATMRAVQPEYLFALKVPSWVNSALLNALLGLLIAVTAMGRLEHFEPPRPLWTRLTATLVWFAFCLALFGPMLGGVLRGTLSAIDLNQHGVVMLGIALVFAALVTPVFNTGDLVVRRDENPVARYLSGFLPHRIFGADLSCGVPLVALWALFAIALYPFGVVVAGKAGVFNPGAAYLPAVILFLAVLAGLAGIGHFLSVTVPSRWAACVLTYLAGVVLTLLPLFTLFAWQPLLPKPKGPQLLWQVLYLTPVEGLGQLHRPAVYWTDHPALIFGTSVPVWLVTTVIYLGIAAAGFLLTAARIQVEGRRIHQQMEAREKAYA